MRLPVRHVAGNVIWTVHGTCWAIWRVHGVTATHATTTDKTRRLAALEALVKALHGESMLLSLCPQIDPASQMVFVEASLAATVHGDPHTVSDRLQRLLDRTGAALRYRELGLI